MSVSTPALNYTVNGGTVHPVGGAAISIPAGSTLVVSLASTTGLNFASFNVSSPNSGLNGASSSWNGSGPASITVFFPPAGGSIVINVSVSDGQNTAYSFGSFYAALNVTSFDSAGNSSLLAASTSAFWFVNVKDFGAKGDGVTDDRAAIQAAVDFAGRAASGQTHTIYFPQPTASYLLSGPIFCPYAGTRFKGPQNYASGSPLSVNLFSQANLGDSFPYFVCSGNNGVISGTGTGAPTLTTRAYNGGNALFARLNPSVGQLDNQGFALSDSVDLGDWTSLTNAFTFEGLVCLLNDITANNTLVYLLTSAGSVDQGQSNILAHNTLTVALDNNGTPGAGQNGLVVQLRTANTTNNNNLNGGMLIRSAPGSIVVNQVHHFRIVYDGAHLTISIDGSPATMACTLDGVSTGTNNALTGNLQQQWVEQVWIGGIAASVITSKSVSGAFTGAPNIAVDIAKLQFTNYALATSYTKPVGGDAFIPGAASNVVIFYIDFANAGTPAGTSPLVNACNNWFIGRSSWRNLATNRQIIAGSPVWMRWRGTIGASYTGDMVFEDFAFGNANLVPPLQPPIVLETNLRAKFLRCVVQGSAGILLDVFSYEPTFQECSIALQGGAGLRSAGLTLSNGTQYVNIKNCGITGGAWNVIADSGFSAESLYIGHNGYIGAIAAGGGGISVSLRECVALNDGSNPPVIAQYLITECKQLTIDGGYVSAGGGSGIPLISLCHVARADLRMIVSPPDTSTPVLRQLDSQPGNYETNFEDFASSPASYIYGAGIPRIGTGIRVSRVLPPSYDATAGGPIVIANGDMGLDRILLTGTPAGAFQVQMPWHAPGLRTRIVNLTGQAATVYTLAPAWAANTRWGGFAVMTPSVTNGKWYFRNVSYTGLPGFSTKTDIVAAKLSNGTSGAVEPTWSTTTGVLTADGQGGAGSGVAGCFWFCAGNVGGSNARQAGNSATVPANSAAFIESDGLGWYLA